MEHVPEADQAPPNAASWPLDRVLDHLSSGGVALLYDGDEREGEIDLVVASQFVTPDVVRQLRTDGGGIVCTTLPHWAHEELGLPYLEDLFAGVSDAHPTLGGLLQGRPAYDRRSSFTVTINHRSTFTGVTDSDRATTIVALARLLRSMEERSLRTPAADVLGQEFRAPGHVSLLNVAAGGLSQRQGHTELATTLIEMAGLTPSATICEMMGDDGHALSLATGVKYASRHGLPLLYGAQVVGAWQRLSGHSPKRDQTPAPSA